MTVGLAMIVKNEVHQLTRLAESLKRLPLSHATIVDTGSTDGTFELLPQLFDCPTEVVRTNWTGFGPARELALASARPFTDWVLMLDADEIFGGDLVVPEVSDVVHVEERHGDMMTWKPRLTNTRIDWRYFGRTHEYLDTSSAESVRSTDWWIEAKNDGFNRTNKFERDIALLLEDWEETPDPRTAFYLGRSYEDLGDRENAAHWYGLRASLGGWAEEAWYARWREGICILAHNPDEGVNVLWRAWEMNPTRAETLVSLAEHYRSCGQPRMAYLAISQATPPLETDKLFIHTDVYDWKIDYELSIAAWYVGAYQQGKRAIERLQTKNLPVDIARSVQANTAFYEESS